MQSGTSSTRFCCQRGTLGPDRPYAASKIALRAMDFAAVVIFAGDEGCRRAARQGSLAIEPDVTSALSFRRIIRSVEWLRSKAGDIAGHLTCVRSLNLPPRREPA